MSVDSVSSSQQSIQQIIDKSAATTKTRNTGNLGKDDFLNLLVTQLRYQDPLNPTDDKEFIGQMAQFSSLEQMTNLNGSFSQSEAFSLIGKNISANITDDATQKTTPITGDVSNVKMSDGKIYLVVNGKDVPVDSVTSVTDGLMSSSNLSSYTNLIGCNVDGIAYDSDTGDMIDLNGNVSAIQKGIYEDYAVLNGVNTEIAGIVSDTDSTDPNYVKDTLQQAYDQKEQISVYIKDSSTGKKVPVTGLITKLNLDDHGKITAVMDGVNVPVEGVTTITKPAQSQTTGNQTPIQQASGQATDQSSGDQTSDQAADQAGGTSGS